MAFVESQQNPGVVAEVDANNRALRTSLRPLDYTTLQGKILGHYSAFGQTAAIAPTAAGNMAVFRWPDLTNFAIVTRVYTCVTVVTAVTAQRTDPLLLFVARGYAVNDATNATAIGINGNNQKMRTTMSSSLLAQGVAPTFNLAVTSNTAGVSGGTKTVDGAAIGAACFGAGPALVGLGTGLGITDLYKWDRLGGHPPVLAANEGVLLQWGTTTLATGTVTVGFGIEWAEVAAF